MSDDERYSDDAEDSDVEKKPKAPRVRNAMKKYGDYLEASDNSGTDEDVEEAEEDGAISDDDDSDDDGDDVDNDDGDGVSDDDEDEDEDEDGNNRENDGDNEDGISQDEDNEDGNSDGGNSDDNKESDDDDKESDDDNKESGDDNKESGDSSRLFLRGSTRRPTEDLHDDDDEEERACLQKFDKTLNQDYILTYHPECKQYNHDEVMQLSRVVRDTNGNVIDPFHRTLDCLTKYEVARIVGQRAKQIETGSKPLVEADGIIDSYNIALRELEQKKIPFIIQRPIPGGASEFWRVEDLRYIHTIN